MSLSMSQEIGNDLLKRAVMKTHQQRVKKCSDSDSSSPKPTHSQFYSSENKPVPCPSFQSVSVFAGL